MFLNICENFWLTLHLRAFPVKCHVEALKDTLLEQNLCRIIEPYSRVEVSNY